MPQVPSQAEHDDLARRVADSERELMALRGRVLSLETVQPPLSPVDPPIGMSWWEDKLAAALLLRDTPRGPRGVALTVLQPTASLSGLNEDISITTPHNGRSLQLVDGAELAFSEIRNGGSVNLQDTTQRQPMVGLPWESGQEATLRRCVVTDSPWLGASGPNGTHKIIECEFARNTLTGVSFFFGIAEASAAKWWNSADIWCIDCLVRDQQAAGMWWDGSAATGGGIRGGLYERCGAWCVYLELGGGFTVDGATFLDTPVAMRIQTDGATIRRVVTIGCPTALFALNENRPDRLGRPVVVDVADSYFDLMSTPDNTHGYGWVDWGGPGPTRFTSGRNTFKIDPTKRVFRAGGAFLDWAGWQTAGFDQDSVLM